MNTSTKTIEEQALLINHLSREFNSLNAANGSYISSLHHENSQLRDDLQVAAELVDRLKHEKWAMEDEIARLKNPQYNVHGSYISTLHDENSQISDDLRIAEDEIVELKWVITKLKENKSM